MRKRRTLKVKKIGATMATKTGIHDGITFFYSLKSFLNTSEYMLKITAEIVIKNIPIM